MVEQLQTAGLAIIVTFEVLGTLFVLLRLWARLLLPSGSWRGLMMWSDISLFVAWLFSVGESFSQYQRAFGYHKADAAAFNDSIADVVEFLKYSLANQLLYNPILSFVKLSMVLLYLRIGGNKREIRIACYALAGFTVLLMAIIFFVDLFQCLPFPYNYNAIMMDIEAQLKAGADENGFKDGKLIKGGRCIAQVNFYLISAGFTILTDLLVLAIPVAMVYDLQMKMKKKVIVISILGMGIGVTGISIARLPVLHWMFDPANPDMLYTVGQTIGAVETGLAMAAACAPDLYPLLSRLFPRLFSSVGNSTSYANGGNGGSRPTRKGYTVSDSNPNHAKSRGGTRVGNHSQVGAAEMYPMDDIEWRTGEKYSRTAAITVTGGASDSAGSRSGSQEDIVPHLNSSNMGGKITKTIQFDVKTEEDDKRWSNI